MQDPCAIAAADALQTFEEYEVDEDPCKESLQAVVSAEPAARPLLLDMAQARLEFYQAITTEPQRLSCYVLALWYVNKGIAMSNDEL